MAFFLIGRGPDDDLRLISPKPFETRQAAMAELSQLSSDPSFPHWDAEVSVMDLDSGVPVLLVRSASAAAPDVVPVVGQSGDADAWQADLPAEQPSVDQPAAEMTPAEPVAPDVAPAAPEPVPEAIEAPSWEPPEVALIEPVGDAAIADAIVEEAGASQAQPEAALQAAVAAPEGAPESPAALAEPEVTPEPETAPVEALDAADQTPVTPPSDAEAAPAEPNGADDNDDLRAAIQRTTEHMAAEGIVAPESVGLEPTAVEASEVAESAAAPAEASVETQFAAEATPAEQPEAPAAQPEAPAAPPKVGFWPWARSASSAEAEAAGGVAPGVAGVYNALEEPADELPEPDVEAALRRPILRTTDVAAPLAADSADLPRSPMSSLAPQETLSAAPAAVDAVDQSDFILDLDAVESAPIASPPVVAIEEPLVPAAADELSSGANAVVDTEAAPSASSAEAEAAEPPAVVSPLQDYTCEDCVYVSTCPNRDQRLPKDCGSFQWR